MSWLLTKRLIYLTGNCGVRPHMRIVGGVTAPKHSWPWQAMLMTKSKSQFCGGTLVHPKLGCDGGALRGKLEEYQCFCQVTK